MNITTEVYASCKIEGLSTPFPNYNYQGNVVGDAVMNDKKKGEPQSSVSANVAIDRQSSEAEADRSIDPNGKSTCALYFCRFLPRSTFFHPSLPFIALTSPQMCSVAETSSLSIMVRVTIDNYY